MQTTLLLRADHLHAIMNPWNVAYEQREQDVILEKQTLKIKRENVPFLKSTSNQRWIELYLIQ